MINEKTPFIGIKKYRGQTIVSETPVFFMPPIKASFMHLLNHLD